MVTEAVSGGEEAEEGDTDYTNSTMTTTTTDNAADSNSKAEAEEKPPKKKVRVCWSCQKNAETDGVTLLKCHGCRRARYCDVECQSEDWEYHWEYCQAVQERRAQRDGMGETI